MAPTESCENPTEHSVTHFILPDLVSDCHCSLRLSPHCYSIVPAAEQWLLQGARFIEPLVTKFMGLKAETFAAACYPDADEFHLRVCLDFLNWLFTMDDWLDEFDPTDTWGMRDSCIGALRDPIHFETDKLGGLMCKSFFGRCIQTSGPRFTKRFIDAMDLVFIAVAKELDDNRNGRIPDRETYITARRNTSACRAAFALIEFASRIDLPDEVVSHPVIMAMENATVDYVAWSNDIFSYNYEQSRRHTYNMVIVLMHEGLGLQGALDSAGALCTKSIQRFEDNRAMLPSWGEEVDKQVAMYIEGLQNWIVGSLPWSFASERYFGKEVEVKQHRTVKLLPKRPL